MIALNSPILTSGYRVVRVLCDDNEGLCPLLRYEVSKLLDVVGLHEEYLTVFLGRACCSGRK